MPPLAAGEAVAATEAAAAEVSIVLRIDDMCKLKVDMELGKAMQDQRNDCSKTANAQRKRLLHALTEPPPPLSLSSLSR
jgi:hypothetical protein